MCLLYVYALLRIYVVFGDRLLVTKLRSMINPGLALINVWESLRLRRMTLSVTIVTYRMASTSPNHY